MRDEIIHYKQIGKWKIMAILIAVSKIRKQFADGLSKVREQFSLANFNYWTGKHCAKKNVHFYPLFLTETYLKNTGVFAFITEKQTRNEKCKQTI